MMQDDTIILCRHCKERRKGRTRGLCSRCYEKKEVRSLYPPDDRSVIKGHGHTVAKDLKGWEPTDHLPGTAEKIKVLERRASKGLPLWHPFDAKRNERLPLDSMDSAQECNRLQLSRNEIGQ
jgi:hypothetical protein